MNKKKLLSCLVFTSLCFSSTHVSAASESRSHERTAYTIQKMFQDRNYVNTELIVKFSKKLHKNDKRNFKNLFNLINIKPIGEDFYVISFSNQTNLPKLVQKLYDNKIVEFVEPNYKIQKEYIPSDPLYKKQWFHSKINTPSAWDTTKGSSDIVVAVIDGGVDGRHPELKGKLYKPYDAVDGDSTYFPDDHGTHVAGIIAASLNTVGVTGIAPNVKVMPINVFYGDSTTAEEISSALYYAADKGADVINMSLGSYYYSKVINDAVAYARSKGAIVVAAAGNDHVNEKTYPAAYKGVFGISATNHADRASYFSNYGSFVDFAAPGEDIYSTIAYGKYGYMSGTSMASPVVTGTIALMLSKNPFINETQVDTILKKSTVDLYQSGRDNLSGFGRIDASLAVKNTPEALSVASLSSKELIINGLNTISTSYKAYTGSLVSIVVKDAKGNIVKTIYKNAKSSGKQVNIKWDGKIDNGSYADSGAYKIIASAVKGSSSRSKELSVNVKNKLKPSIAVGKTTIHYSPKVSKAGIVHVKLNKTQLVTAKIFDSKGGHVKNIITNKIIIGGSQTIGWSGKNSSGKQAPDGNYLMRLDSIDSDNQRADRKTVEIIVDSKPPLIKINSITPSVYKTGKSMTVVSNFSINETSNVTIYVVNNNGQKIRTLANKKSLKLGTHSQSWDGKAENKTFANAGKYRFIIESIDVAGNKSLIQSSWFSLK
ncbi:S8 family serine peptidase [Fictibacillus nanhaiensis]|uniref:S8 family serine peptidase n=1 Tax=Fictibacillus nanhaiensis TaxID=742169 RepID=A0ABS2ZMT5_9BACL|nr:S8 family serine peptidase [Fictibacillus nanhaiensis]